MKNWFHPFEWLDQIPTDFYFNNVLRPIDRTTRCSAERKTYYVVNGIMFYSINIVQSAKSCQLNIDLIECVAQLFHFQVLSRRTNKRRHSTATMRHSSSHSEDWTGLEMRNQFQCGE